MRIFILEDSNQRMRHFREGLIGASIVHANTYPIACGILARESFDALFFDYDLPESNDPNCGCGADVSRYVRQMAISGAYPSHTAMHCIHSLNPEGAVEIHKDFEAASIPHFYSTFAWLDTYALQHLVHTREWILPKLQKAVLHWD